MGFIFISHSSLDNKIVLPICEFLERQGINCWIDKDDIPDADKYKLRIIKDIQSEDCLGVLLILSHNANISFNVGTEIAIAKQYTKTIIPYQIVGVNHPSLFGELYYDVANYDIIDASNDPVGEENKEILLKTIKYLLKNLYLDGIKNRLNIFEQNKTRDSGDFRVFHEWAKLLTNYANELEPTEAYPLFKKAQEKFEQALLLNHKDNSLLIDYANMLLYLNNISNDEGYLAKANEYYQQVLDESKNNFELNLRYAKFLTDAGMFDRANDYYNIAYKLNNFSDKLYFEWGKLFLKKDDTSYLLMACDKFKSAMDLNPKRKEILFLWRDALERINRQNFNLLWEKDNKPIFDINLLEDQLFVNFYYKTAVYFMYTALFTIFTSSNSEENERVMAIDYFSKAAGLFQEIQSFNFNYNAANDLAVSHAYLALLGNPTDSADHLTKAIEVFEIMVKEGTENPDLYINWGCMLIECATKNEDRHTKEIMFKEAIEKLMKALELAPYSSATRHNLGLAMKNLAHLKTGLEAYKLMHQAVDYLNIIDK